MTLPQAAPRLRIRVPQVALGLVLIAAFFGLDRTSNTTHVKFIAPWDASSRGELYFWLGALMFLLPGAALLFASFAPLADPWLTRVSARLRALSTREWQLYCVLLVFVAWLLARLGNQLVLMGQPFTDDEDAARFGGQVLALGKLWVPLPPMRFAFPDMFLFQLNGRWTSFEFLGAMLPWTFSELTDSDTLVFSLFASAVPVAVAVACARRHGPLLGAVAGCVVLCSPMAATLSMTSHTHVISRGFIAIGLGTLLFVERASFWRSLAAGLAFGCAFVTRPPETTLLLLPLACAWTYGAVRDQHERPRLYGLLAGTLPWICAMFAYNHALTGSFGFPRSFPNEIVGVHAHLMGPPLAFERFATRFGNNLSYNLLTLSIWFFGPLGLVLAWLGARASREHMLLGLGVLCHLGLTLLTDDRGLHMVGPIHLSELAVPLTFLLVAALEPALEALSRAGIARSTACMALLGYAVLGLGVFTGWHSEALQEQALARATLMDMIDGVSTQPAVVLVGSYSEMRVNYTPYGRAGGFVFEWRRARPDLADPVLVLHDSPEARHDVKQAFPMRQAYVLDPTLHGLALRELDEHTPASAASMRPPAQ